MVDARGVLVTVGFLWLILELLRFPVPSEASVYQLLFTGTEHLDDRSCLAIARRRASVAKLLWYGLPTALGVSLFLIALAAAWWRPLLDYLVPLPGLLNPTALWFGAGSMLSGRILTFTSVLQLRRRLPRADVHRGGLFRWSRNPGLVGMYAYYIGVCFVLPCVVLFAGVIPYVWNMHTRVLLEESYLAARFGEQYARYRRKVPRYVFF